ncbi:hypothetical protein J2X16_002227 [Pelomonas aquatica]|uniref:Uncharacterized protein n=1 Tax=Pelomonas aquatica TaxID=431058 RepID=A0ABU1ZA56_9BURK|nr:hypothetical protein [Pelomonas aquatica]
MIDFQSMQQKRAAGEFGAVRPQAACYRGATGDLLTNLSTEIVGNPRSLANHALGLDS